MANTQLGTVLRHLRGMVDAKATDNASDGELLERFVGRQEEAAFVALLIRHGPMVYSVCRRIGRNEHDAEDAFQATFLILARKARSIRKVESVASWLHAVAYRLALEAKGQDNRRQAREKQAADMRKTSSVSDMAWQELQVTLDDALRQVPQTYRAPLLLCYLEGKTQEEAARQLGCPLGTVRSRLARGRARLKLLLERRGVRLSATALAAALAANEASAAVPALLFHATARAAFGYAAGMAPTALVSARAATLLEGGLQAMATMKLKSATAMVFLLGLLGFGTGALICHVAASSPTLPVPARPAEPIPKDQQLGNASGGKENSDQLTVRGRVLDSQGKPASGARLLLLGDRDDPVDLGTSAADGSFVVLITKQQKSCSLVAGAAGAGIDFMHCGQIKSNTDIELRMVKDNAIRGRIIDTEGKPVRGVQVAVDLICVYADNSVASFLAEWVRMPPYSGSRAKSKVLMHRVSFLDARSDSDGRFVIAGIGAERVSFLRLQRAGIAQSEVWVVNRDRFDPKPYNEALHNYTPQGLPASMMRQLLSGPDISIVAETEKTIHGVVKDADSNKPRVGVQVTLWSNVDTLSQVLRATTDEQGRYEIHGCRKQKSYTLQIDSDPETGFLGRRVNLPDTSGYEPISADIRVAKGVVVTGRMLDGSNGKAVPGKVNVGILSDNLFVRRRPEFDSAQENRVISTSADGTFRIVTIPGPVLLTGGPMGTLESMKYKPVLSDARYPQYFPNPGDPVYYSTGGSLSIIQGIFCKVLEIEPDAQLVTQDIILQPASEVPVRIQDTEGRPLTGAWAAGMAPWNWYEPMQIERDSCSVYHVMPGKPRVVVFYEPTRKLVGMLKLKGDESSPVIAKLGPHGALKGRCTAEDGKPLAGIVIDIYYADSAAQAVHRFAASARPQVVTDAKGAFAIGGLIPGAGLKLYKQSGRMGPNRRPKPLSDNLVTVKPAELLNLGDLKVKVDREPDGE